jgi:hypothetical protein
MDRGCAACRPDEDQSKKSTHYLLDDFYGEQEDELLAGPVLVLT